jgi:hypothetical protein
MINPCIKFLVNGLLHKQKTKKMKLKSGFTFFFAIQLFFIFLATNASAQVLPGKHPAYIHALHDLRDARWYLYHQPSDTKVYADEDMAISETDAAINEVVRAGLDDHKNIHSGVPVDVKEHGSRLLKSIELLTKAHSDIAQEEDNPEARNLRKAALYHLDKAIAAAKKAHDAWLKEIKK